MFYTYQDLVEVGESESGRMDFVKKVIANHRSSADYQIATVAEEYASHRNKTINDFQKLLYTVTGKVIPDNYTANFKMASGFFGRFVTQQNQYLLGNGVGWTNEDTEDKLGNDKYSFDTQLQKAGEIALIEKVAFGFWNVDHVEVFKYTEFAPLYDEENGMLMAGIRFWQIAPNKPLRATLYEIDGYTNIIWKPDKDYEILQNKTSYKLTVRESVADGSEIYDGENYPTLPIVPLWGNKYHQSELVGIREQIDCYDLIKSGFANDVDDASYVYWTINNAGGMDDKDLVKFVEHMKTVKAAVVDDDGATAESHTMDIPYASREALLDRLEKDLYKDFMALNTEAIADGAVTATQIKAAYEPINSKVDNYEYCVVEFIQGILALAGVDDEPTFTRSIIVNANENIETLLQASQYLDPDYVTQKILEYFGDGDKADQMLKDMDSDNLNRMTRGQGEDEWTTATSTQTMS